MTKSAVIICFMPCFKQAPLSRRERSSVYVVAAIAALGAAMLLHATSLYGVATNWDSGGYISGARSLAAGRGFVNYYGTPLTSWPPLYPAVLAFLSSFGLGPLDGARYLNALCFAGAVFFCGLWLAKRLEHASLAVLGAASVLLSRPLLDTFVYACSDAPFTLLAIVSIAALGAFLDEGGRRGFYLSASFASLAWLTRYIGVTVVAAEVIALLAWRRTPMKGRLRDAALFGFIASAPTAVWLARNYASSETLMGKRYPSPFSLAYNLNMSLDVLSSWLFPPEMDYGQRAAITCAALVVLAAVFFITLLDRRAARRTLPASFLLVSLFVFVYTGWLVYSASVVAFDGLSDRFFVPVYPFLAIIVFFVVDRALIMLKGAFAGGAAAALVVAALCAVLTIQAFQARAAVAGYATEGAGGFSTTEWERSPLLAFLSTNRLDGRVYTNCPPALYFLAGFSESGLMPRRYEHNSPQIKTRGMDTFERQVLGNPRIYVVWFDRVKLNEFYNEADLLSTFVCEVVKKFPDGTIYLVKGKRLGKTI